MGKRLTENKLLAISVLLMLTINLLGVSLNILDLAEGQVSSPELKVEPSTYEAMHTNETFNIKVMMSDLDASLKAVALQFRLCYNATLLEVVDVVEGPFMQDSRWNLYGTLFINYTEPDGTYGPHVLVGILLIPNHATGEYDQTQFPRGSGILATITFRVLPSLPGACSLHLDDTLILDNDLGDIAHSTQDGTYYSPRPALNVEPTMYTGTHIGETFDINVTISNTYSDWKIISIQFRLCYNATLLEVVDVVEGPFMQDSRWNLYGTYFIKYVEEYKLYGPHVVVGIMLLPNATGEWTNFPYGNGTLATITFEVIHRTIEPAPSAECVLNLTDTMIIDENLNEVEHTTADATYKAEQIPLPTLTVQPDTYNATRLGEMFDIDVCMSGLDNDLRLVGLQFRLGYNATLLEVVDVVEGPFLQQFGDTFFIYYVEIDDPRHGTHVLVGIQLLPNATGEWTNFPYGNGTLATITFKSISLPGEPKPLVSSVLTLNDTMLINDNLEEIPHNVSHGYYEIQPLTFTYQPVLPINGEVVLFQAPSYPTEVTYMWNFGDGTISNITEATVGHAYNKPGNYNVTLMISVNDLSSDEAEKTISVSTGLYVPVEVTVDVGSLHFNGEIVEFYILVVHLGKAVNATNIEANLYYDGILYIELSDLVQLVDTGIYRIPYTIAGEAEAGTYTLVVKVEYFNVDGTNMKSFLISSTLTSWGDSIVQITEIKDGIATITTDIDLIKLNLTAINAKLVSIEGTMAIIESDLGTLQTDLTNVNATITDIIVDSKGEILAQIDSDLGSITTSLEAIDEELTAFKSTTTIGVYIAAIFSVIATVVALAVIVLIIKRPR